MTAWLTTTRKVLLSLMIVGATGTTIGAGTHASFNATATNDAEFVTGTLVLENVKDDGTDAIGIGSACFSTGGDDTDDNHEVDCQSLIDVEVKRPGDLAFADLTVINDGSLGGDLFLEASQACASSPTIEDPDALTFIGNGDACIGTRMTVQEYTSGTNRDDDVTTGGDCWYGGGTAEACALDDSFTLEAFSDATAVTPIDMGPLAAGGERVLRIVVELPEDSSNDLQGVQAHFGFTWTLVQEA